MYKPPSKPISRKRRFLTSLLLFPWIQIDPDLPGDSEVHVTSPVYHPPEPTKRSTSSQSGELMVVIAMRVIMLVLRSSDSFFGRALDSWLWPLLLPITSFVFALAWTPAGISFLNGILVFVAFLADLYSLSRAVESA